MKKFVTLIFLVTIFFISCNDDPPENDNETDDNFSNDVTVTDNDIDEVQGVDNEESDTVEEVPDDDSCGRGIVMNPEWMQPDSDWKYWGYLGAVGVIGDYHSDAVPAVYIDGKIKLSEVIQEFAEGYYSNYENQVLLADAYWYEVIDVNADPTAVIDYWGVTYQFNQQLVPVLKEEGVREAGFGAAVFFRHAYLDIETDVNGEVVKQQTRKNCYVAISKTEELEEEGEIYDVPIGDILGCFDCAVNGSVGEKLYMMFKNEMTEDQDHTLEYFNTRSDDTVAVFGDEDFMHLCQCYDEEGNEVNCWQYDGPGGPEECPDYVPEEDCNPAQTDEDVISDEDAASD